MGFKEELAENKINYGKHYPNGYAAVEYIYDSEGTWGKVDDLKYTYNYYPQYATKEHPFNKEALIKEAAENSRTCRDANGHLLFDKDGKEQELVNPIPPNSYAFCEHTGKGCNGHRSTPFHNYWFDDNTLAKNMSKAYHKPEPKGLYPYSDFNRWSVIGDSLATYKPYGTMHIDCLALDGIYFYRQGKFEAAYECWKKIIEVSHPAYDPTNQRFEYSMPDIYHFGLSALLSAILMDCDFLSADQRNITMQHYVSLRSLILAKQVVEDGIIKGWLSGHHLTDLINTETIAANVLGLGAGADLVFEGGKAPMDYSKDCNFYIRSHNVISAAVEGGSKIGFLCLGPYWDFEGGHKYIVEFFVRASYPSECGAEVSVYDMTNKKIIATSRVAFHDGTPGLNWTKARLSFALPVTGSLSFRCYWFGGTSSRNNMDLSFIRIKGAD